MVIEGLVEASEPLNVPADRLKQAFKWVERAKELPPAFAIAINSTIWLERVDAFRAMEEDLLIRGEYQRTLDEHRAVLAELIADGERIIFFAKNLGIEEFPSDFTLKDLQATLDSLHVT